MGRGGSRVSRGSDGFRGVPRGRGVCREWYQKWIHTYPSYLENTLSKSGQLLVRDRHPGPEGRGRGRRAMDAPWTRHGRAVDAGVKLLVCPPVPGHPDKRHGASVDMDAPWTLQSSSGPRALRRRFARIGAAHGLVEKGAHQLRVAAAAYLARRTKGAQHVVHNGENDGAARG